MAVTTASGPSHYSFPSPQQISPSSKANPFDTLDMQHLNRASDRVNGRMDFSNPSAILMRKLPRNTTQEGLTSMLLFAKDLISADFTPAEYAEDKGFLTAMAHFRTAMGAQEARRALDGKPNTAGEATMIVEMLQRSPSGSFTARRNTIEVSASASTATSVSTSRDPRGSTSSSSSSGAQATRQSSRFNSTFQSIDQRSSPGELRHSESASSFPNMYAQASMGAPLERQRISGKSVIDEDAFDDETGRLLHDPVAYAKNDMAGNMAPTPRRSTLPQLPTERFASLSLGSNLPSPSMTAMTTPRGPIMSPSANFTANAMSHMGPNASYQLANHHHLRHNYPPVNPADQNPPCNTLYVGNLPIDTSEDELKAMFSKQRGYKRLCFRTKQNGPMCFVEFEDVSFATKALNELYGHPLHNSVKGGIRLSFSKNPLGVRTGQPGGMGLPSPVTPSPGLSGMSGMSGMPGMPGMPGMNIMPGLHGFHTAAGPPPGLQAPPGLLSGGLANPASNGYGIPISPGIGMSGMGLRSPAFSGPSATAGHATWGQQAGASISAYMMGR